MTPASVTRVDSGLKQGDWWAGHRNDPVGAAVNDKDSGEQQILARFHFDK